MLGLNGEVIRAMQRLGIEPPSLPMRPSPPLVPADRQDDSTTNGENDEGVN